MAVEDQIDKIRYNTSPWWRYWGPCFKYPMVQMELKDGYDIDELRIKALLIAKSNAIQGYTKNPNTMEEPLENSGDFCACGTHLTNADYFLEHTNKSNLLFIIYECPMCGRYCFIPH